ncbi:uncharacterized protein FIBRA_08114 [Fibroporia radiculosa]|uniref:Uncharacterized protein n=1 Tax=Fibroporia radiculosa TaxID=599839 RepID=J4I275_9APHY|nr:uncharacterized protein FIBRA_08114 [Fibroporia radiculosa]CCM05877.1 predicted protein [Fibroporia radiculosa]
MPTGKLHLKRTPAEQAERDFRKAQKAVRKASRKRRHADSSDDEWKHISEGGSNNSSRATHKPSNYTYVFSDDEYGPPPPPPASTSFRTHKQDYDTIYAQLEEERFREKIFEAMEDDERLDGVESRLNSYAHIPRRWRSGGMDKMDDEEGVKPHMMEEEDYAERKHAAEYAEQERKKAERAARRAREKAVRKETSRLERAADDERKRRRRSKERRKVAEIRLWYDTRWKELLAVGKTGEEQLTFPDIPWPVLPSESDDNKSRRVISLGDITAAAISTFLLLDDEESVEDVDVVKRRKDKLRETMLRYHPDKFEGRIMSRVTEIDREKVRDALGIVVRAINELLGERR